MKKNKIQIIKILFLLFIVCFLFGFRNICVYYPYGDGGLTSNTCTLYSELIDLDSKSIDSINNELTQKHDIVIINGFGSQEGIYLDAFNSNIVSWCDLIKNINTKMLIVDACYSGNIFRCRDFNKKIPTIITSTNDKSVSVNIIVNNKIYTSLSLALTCMVKPDKFDFCKTFIGCKYKDIQLCQFEIIMKKNNFDDFFYNTLYRHPEKHPNLSIGLAMINDVPFR